jgi:KaiC/GvpD/RAD55 family RecA-like ATPase
LAVLDLDVERLLISRILSDKDLGPTAEAGITSKFFLDPKDRAVFDRIVEFNTQHDSVPSLAALKIDFPEYKFVKPSNPLSFLIEEIRRKHALSLISVGMEEAVEAYGARDPDTAVGVLLDAINQIANDIPVSRDTDLTETGIERMQRYLALRDNPDYLLGAPTGFDTIDRATQGLQKEHLVTIVGPPKVGKSTILLLTAMAAWVHGFTVLMFTFEMSNDEMSERFDAFKAGISAHRLRTGRLKKDEWIKLEKMMRQIESMPPFWFSADTSGASTLSGIAAKVNKIKPDVLLVDGIYMMIDEITGESNTSQSLTNLTRGFKRLAQNKQLPVVISTQVLLSKMDAKNGVTLNSIGYSSSFGQDSNTVIGIEKTPDPAIMRLKVLAARNCPPLDVCIQWDWELGIFEELNGDPFSEMGKDDWDDSKAKF